MSDLVVELDDATIAELRERAARKGISLNEEVLATLREAVRAEAPLPSRSVLPAGERKLAEPEIQERLRRLKMLGQKPLTPVDLKVLSDELSDSVG